MRPFLSPSLACVFPLLLSIYIILCLLFIRWIGSHHWNINSEKATRCAAHTPVPLVTGIGLALHSGPISYYGIKEQMGASQPALKELSLSGRRTSFKYKAGFAQLCNPWWQPCGHLTLAIYSKIIPVFSATFEITGSPKSRRKPHTAPSQYRIAALQSPFSGLLLNVKSLGGARVSGRCGSCTVAVSTLLLPTSRPGLPLLSGLCPC